MHDSRLPQSFWEKVTPHASGCWLWRVGRGQRYGRHRRAYEALVGPIPKGLTIDHLCRTPACVNPYHMEVVTIRENILRSDGVAAVNSRKTECVHGHPTLVTRKDRRSCLACNRAADRQRAKDNIASGLCRCGRKRGDRAYCDRCRELRARYDKARKLKLRTVADRLDAEASKESR